MIMKKYAVNSAIVTHNLDFMAMDQFRLWFNSRPPASVGVNRTYPCSSDQTESGFSWIQVGACFAGSGATGIKGLTRRSGGASIWLKRLKNCF